MKQQLLSTQPHLTTVTHSNATNRSDHTLTNAASPSNLRHHPRGQTRIQFSSPTNRLFVTGQQPDRWGCIIFSWVLQHGRLGLQHNACMAYCMGSSSSGFFSRVDWVYSITHAWHVGWVATPYLGFFPREQRYGNDIQPNACMACWMGCNALPRISSS